MRKCLIVVISYLTADEPERPDWNDVDDGSEGNADDDEDQVGSGESNDQDVGGVSHVLVGCNNDDHRQVPDEAEQRDETEDDRNDDAHEVFEDDVRAGRLDRHRRTVGRHRRRSPCRRRRRRRVVSTS